MLNTELARLVEVIGLPQAAVARLLDVQPTTLNRWLAGTQKIQHPAMLKKALQMITLENQGMVTEALLEAVKPQAETLISEVLASLGEHYGGPLAPECYLNSPPNYWYTEKDYRGYFEKKKPVHEVTIGDQAWTGRVIKLSRFSEEGKETFALLKWGYFRRLTESEAKEFKLNVAEAIEKIKTA